MDVHLLEAAPVPGRYRFHDLLRLYARERVHADETAQERGGAQWRMLDWYLGTARAASGLLEPGRRLLPRDDENESLAPPFATYAEATTWFEAEQTNLV